MLCLSVVLIGYFCQWIYDYPVPRGFACFFFLYESCDRAAKRWTRVAQQRGRKTSGYLGRESHFHADARVRIWNSGSDWMIFLQTRKSIRLVRSFDWQCRRDGEDICHCTSWGKVYQGKNLFAKYVSSQFIRVQDSSVFLTVSSKEFWPRYSRSIFQRLKISPSIKFLLAVIIIARMCCHTANRTWKSIIKSVDP